MTTPSTLLVASRMQVNRANAISAPMTWGFPAMPAFLGVQWALNRRMGAVGIPLRATRVAVVAHQTVVRGGSDRFSLARHPRVLENKSKNIFQDAPFFEEGFMHMEISLIFEMQYLSEALRDEHVLDRTGNASRETAARILDLLHGIRIAGGEVMPRVQGLVRNRREMAFFVDPDDKKAVRRLKYHLLPGFALVARPDLLTERAAAMPSETVFEAWLDLIRFNYRAASETEDEADAGKPIPWRADDRPAGYLVPVPVGYRAISRMFAPGELAHSRDPRVPAQFVEALYTIGQWVSPHRASASIDKLLWSAKWDAEAGLYLCQNDYAAASEEGDFEESSSNDVPTNEDDVLAQI